MSKILKSLNHVEKCTKSYQCNLDMDKIDDPFLVDTELIEKFLPKYNEADSELRRHDANAEDGKKRRIWLRNHLVLRCVLVAAGVINKY